MTYSKHCVLLFVFMVNGLSTAQTSPPSISLEDIQTALQKAPLTRPSLLFSAEQEKAVRAKIETDPFFKALAETIIQDADRRVGQKPVERIVTGKRLLSVSRECLTRVLCLAAAYRLTGEKKYFKQAEAEMLAAAAFKDWLPSHFLGVAEMTAALAIGYDWLYADLSDKSKTAIREAIVNKGVKMSYGSTKQGENLKHNWWLDSGNNWNQVCNGGITLGALAVRDEEPELAAMIVHRAVTTVKRPMDEYEPDGAYPEGPGYWGYGTSYNVILIEALMSVFGTDFGLSENSGFSQGGDYFLHMTAPSGLLFNYSDCGRVSDVSPALFWFARRYDKAYLLLQEIPRLWSKGASKIARPSSRFYPLLLVWGQSEAAVPSQKNWIGRGKTPVAAFRSSWTDPNAAYLAIKGGSASSNHAHMDAGSFVYEADGVRWAIDLGTQSYYEMESHGLDIFGRGQNSDRWKVFRHTNFSHNTLTVNDQLHNYNGVAPILRFSDNPSRPHAVVEMSDIFKDQLAKAVRTAALLPDRRVLIQDEWKAGDKPAAVRWSMVVPGKIKILSPTTARLSKKGKTLMFELSCSKATQMKITQTDPRAEWDNPNPDTSILGFEITLAPQEEIRLAVMLTPGSVTDKQGIAELIPRSSTISNPNSPQEYFYDQ